MRLLILVASAIMLLACNGEGPTDKKDNRLYIVTTTGMIADAVESIVGDKATVVALMGPGVDPHLYKASQGDLTQLRKADIIFYNGLLLEGKMQEIFNELSKTKRVFAVTAQMDALLREVAQHAGVKTFDPHIWFDVMLWSEAVKYTRNKLVEADSLNASFYTQNTTAYLEKLKQLDKDIEQNINNIPEQNRILITSHDAFGYFGRAYGIDVRALQGISTAAEFGLKDITDMVDMIINDKVKSVFIESSVSEKSINAVIEGCESKGHHVKLGGTLYSDAMGNKGTPDGSYIGMVEHNVNTIVDALK